MSILDKSAQHPAQAIYADHHSWLVNVLRRKLGNSFDAADLAQDAFLRLLLKPRFFTSSNSTRAYLSVVARGLVIDLWRRRSIEQAWLEALSAQSETFAASEEERHIALETLYQIDAMLRRLPVKVRTAFLLSQLHGMTYSVIAQKLQVSERMVKKYMAQAMLHCIMLEANK